MLVAADIVKTVNQKETVGGLLLHGVVRGIIDTPAEYQGVVLSSGELAVLDLYAVSCKQENYFETSETTLLTPKGSVVFALEDRSLVGKLVTIGGVGYNGYAKLRKQKTENKVTGFNCLEFRKSTGANWVVVPNKVLEFTRTDNKEVTGYLLQCKEYGFNYLETTKKYLMFAGASSYHFKDLPEVGQTSDSKFTTSFVPTWSPNVNELVNKFYSAKERNLSTGVDDCLSSEYTHNLMESLQSYNQDSELPFRLIPNTTSRFIDVFPIVPVNSYSRLVSILFKTNLTDVGAKSGLDYDQVGRVLYSKPHYLYLKGEISFELAEKVYYINGLTDKNDSAVFFRNVSLIVEGAKSKYRKDGTTYLLNSLSSNLTCKVPEILRENIKSTGTPLSKDEYGFVNYFVKSLPKYDVDSKSMYYNLKDSNIYLQDAQNFGLIIQLKNHYILTELAEMELSIIQRISELQNCSIDYSDSTMDMVLKTMEDERNVQFNNSQRSAFLMLNSNIGVVMANGVSNKEALEEAFHLMFFNETSSNVNTTVLVKDSEAPSWVKENGIRVVKLSELDKTNLNEGSMVIVHDANTWSMEDYYRLMKQSFKSLYLFGNPYTSTNYFRTICSSVPRAYTFAQTVLDLPISITNNGYKVDLQGGKKVVVKETSKVSTLDVLVRMLRTAFDKDFSFENTYVISDLTKQLGAYKVSKKLVDLLGYTKEFEENDLVYDENGVLFKVLYTRDEDMVYVWRDGYEEPKRVSSSKLTHALCVTSDISVRNPKDIAFVLAQPDFGVPYREDVLQSLDSATRGVSFIGHKEYISRLVPKYGSLHSTVLQKRVR